VHEFAAAVIQKHAELGVLWGLVALSDLIADRNLRHAPDYI